jgi:hypothetical protein
VIGFSISRGRPRTVFDFYCHNCSRPLPGRDFVAGEVHPRTKATSVYGLGRFPVTLYRVQWEKLLGMADEICRFIRENDGTLKIAPPRMF